MARQGRNVLKAIAASALAASSAVGVSIATIGLAAAATPTVTVAGPSSPVAGPVSYTVTVTGSGPSPTGYATISDGSNTCIVPALGGSGSGSCSLIEAAGSYTLSASYSGDPNYGSATGAGSSTVGLGTAHVTVTGAPNAVSGPVSYSVRVQGYGPIPSGSVSVSDGLSGSCTISSLSLSGFGSCSIIESAADSPYSVTASYAGDSNYGAASGGTTEDVSSSAATGTAPAVTGVATSDKNHASDGSPVMPSSGSVGFSVDGTGFCGATSTCPPASISVAFVNESNGDSYAASAVDVVNDTTLGVVAQADMATGTYHTEVTVDGLTSTTSSSDVITFLPEAAEPIGVSSLSGGETAYVNGYGYEDPSGTPDVTGMSLVLGGTHVTVSTFAVLSNNEISFTAPAASVAGTYNAVLTTALGSAPAAGRYIYEGPLSVSSVSRNSGPIGDASGPSLTVKGTGFAADTTAATAGVTSVTWDTTGASPVTIVPSCTSTTCSFQVPDYSTAGTVTWSIFTNTSSDSSESFTYTSQTFSSSSPSGGPVSGADVSTPTVTVNGSGFYNKITTISWDSGATTVTPSCTPLHCTFKPPPTSTAGPVFWTISTGSVTSGQQTYTYYDEPTLTSESATSGPAAGGNRITIQGTNFVPNETKVFFGTVKASVVDPNETTLAATVPKGPAGNSVTVTVETPGGTVTFTYSYT